MASVGSMNIGFPVNQTELTPNQVKVAAYFRKLFSDTVKSFGRSIMANILMDKDECFIYLKDHKNNNRTLQVERTFAIRDYLGVLINDLSSEIEKNRVGINGKAYDFKDVIFNYKFTEDWHEKLFGHKFQLTIIPQSQGRVIPLGITILHTPAEWQVYENQCSEQVDALSDSLARGEVQIS